MGHPVFQIKNTQHLYFKIINIKTYQKQTKHNTMSESSYEGNEKIKENTNTLYFYQCQFLYFFGGGAIVPSVGTIRLASNGKNATIKACWKVRTTIVSTTFQIPRAVRINIAIAFTNVTLIRVGTTIPSTRSSTASRS